jgi:hypothetical protein
MTVKSKREFRKNGDVFSRICAASLHCGYGNLRNLALEFSRSTHSHTHGVIFEPMTWMCPSAKRELTPRDAGFVP